MPIWAAAIGGAVSLFSGSKASKQAKKEAAAQREMQQQQIALGREQLQFGMSQYNDWRGKFDPLYDDVKALAYEQRNPNFGQLQADIGATMDASRGAERRTMARYGMNPTDGGWGAGERQYGIARATSVADAANRLRMSEADKRFSRIAGLSSMLNPMANMGQSNISGGYGATGNAMGGAAATHGNNSANYANQAGQAFGNAGYAIGSGLTAWQKQRSGGSGLSTPGAMATPQFSSSIQVPAYSPSVMPGSNPLGLTYVGG